MAKLISVVLFTAMIACYVLAEELEEDLKGRDTNKFDQVRSNLHPEIARSESDDVIEGSDFMKRGGQVLGIGGRCAWYNEKCRGLTTHCCDPWVCKYKKWYHRLSKTGGRCM